MASPEVKELDDLRNHLEHKYAKIVDQFHRFTKASEHFTDHLAHVIERDDLVSKASLIVTLSRYALINLNLATHFEEQQRRGRKENLYSRFQ